MAIATCRNCGDYFDDPLPAIFCSDTCREQLHRRLKPPPEPRKPAKPTLSLRRAWLELSDEAGRYDAYHDRMRSAPR